MRNTTPTRRVAARRTASVAALTALVGLMAPVPAVSGPVRAAGLPPGTVACKHGARSLDTDPRGLNVRAAPSARARMLGRLSPPFRFSGASTEAGLEGGYRTEFRIIGYRKGWFLIEGAEPPGQDYEPEGSLRGHPRPYAGRGWVAAGMVGAQYANGDTRMGGLFAEPREDAPWRAAKNEAGEPISVDGGPRRILACKGDWAYVGSHDGVRGWWRSLCSNQVTNCS